MHLCKICRIENKNMYTVDLDRFQTTLDVLLLSLGENWTRGIAYRYS